jgi:outer membrane lipoprotein
MATFFYFLALLLLPGCVSSQLVAPEMEPRVARGIPFESLKAEPEKFKGRLVVLGGKVLSAKRLKEGTQIEILQLPLDAADAPIMDLADSQGRFLAYQVEFLDPAKLPAGTRVSMIAELTGAKTLPLDEVEYTYPTFKVGTIKIWPEYYYYYYWWPSPRPYLYRQPYHPFYPAFPYWWDPWY